MLGKRPPVFRPTVFVSTSLQPSTACFFLFFSWNCMYCLEVTCIWAGRNTVNLNHVSILLSHRAASKFSAVRPPSWPSFCSCCYSNKSGFLVSRHSENFPCRVLCPLVYHPVPSRDGGALNLFKKYTTVLWSTLEVCFWCVEKDNKQKACVAEGLSRTTGSGVWVGTCAGPRVQRMREGEREWEWERKQARVSPVPSHDYRSDHGWLMACLFVIPHTHGQKVIKAPNASKTLFDILTYLCFITW